jgi:molybdopterin synthase catalytic subunit
MTVRIQTGDFDLSAEIAGLRLQRPQVGAVVSFVGTVRDMNDGAAVTQMELEHYPGMTEKALQRIVAQAQARWAFLDALVIHRVGPLQPLDQIVLVAVAAARGLRCLRIHHGLPENGCTVLEKGTDAGRRALGRRAHHRYCRAQQMG